MAMLQRAELPGGATVRQETFTLASLGGDVIVRGRGLAEELLVSSLEPLVPKTPAVAGQAAPEPDPTKERELRIRHGADVVAYTLHLQVVLEDGQPMWTPEEWKQHGAVHPKEVLDLYKVAERLSGADTEALEKN